MTDAKKPWEQQYGGNAASGGTEPWKQDYGPDADQAPSAPRGLKGWTQDAAAWAVKGAIAVPEAVVGAADLVSGGRVGKALENEGGAFGLRFKQAREAVNEWHSDATKEAQRKFQEAEGLGGKLQAAIENPSNIVGTVVESIPAMGLGGVAARGLMAGTRLGQMGAKGAVLAGAGGEGATMAGSAAEQIRQETKDGLLTPEQTAAAAATGLVGGAIGVAAGRLQNRLGIGDVDTMLAQGNQGIAKQFADEAATAAANPLVQQRALKSIPRQVIEGAISEGFLEELPQSVSEQILQNLALGKDWMQDVDTAVVLGTLSGAAMGGGAAGYRAMREPRAGAADAGQPADAPGANAVPPAGAPDPAIGPAAEMAPGVEPAQTAVEAPAPSPGLEAVRREFSARMSQLQQEEGGEPEVPQSTPPDGAAILAQQRAQEQARRDAETAANRAVQSPDDEILQSTGAAAPIPPSRAMGLDPAAGSLSTAAALAVDSGAAAATQQATALAQAAQQAAKAPAKKDQAAHQTVQAPSNPPAGVNTDTGEVEPVARAAQVQERLDYLAQQGRAQGWSKAAVTERNALRDELAQLQPSSVSPTTNGALNGTQAAQTLAPSAQSSQAARAQGAPAAGPANAKGLTDGAAPTPNPGAQAAAAPGPQAQAQGQAVAQHIDAAGAAWTRMPAAKRKALAERIEGLKPVLRKGLPGAQWKNLNVDLQRKLADAMQPQGAAPAAATAAAPAPTAGEQQAQAVAAEGNEGRRAKMLAASERWASMPVVERQAVAKAAKGLNAPARAGAHARAWADLAPKVREKLAAAMSNAAVAPAAPAAPAVAAPVSTSEPAATTVTAVAHEAAKTRKPAGVLPESMAREPSVEEFPLREAAASYSGISHQGTTRANSDREAFEGFLAGQRNDGLSVAKTQAQKAAVEAEVQQLRQEYLQQYRMLMGVRAGTYSGFVAGRSGLNSKQAGNRNSGLDRAMERFASWVSTATGRVRKAALAARTPAEVQAAREAAATARQEKDAARLAKDLELVGRVLDWKKGNRSEFAKGTTLVGVNKDRAGYPSSVLLEPADGTPLVDNKFDLAGLLRHKGESVPESRQRVRDLVDRVRAERGQSGSETAEVAPKRPRGILAKKAATEEAARADYFAPGNIVKGYGEGHDRIVSYTPANAEGAWSVTVQPVEKQGDAWVDVPGQRERTHATPPDARALKAGPVKRSGDAVFSTAGTKPAQGMPVQRVQEIADRILDDLGIGPVAVLKTVGKPADAGFRVPASVIPQGATRGREVYLFAEGLADPLEVFRVVVHELFHLGLSKSVSQGAYIQTMLGFLTDPLVRQYAQRWKDTADGQSRKSHMPVNNWQALAVEEAMADISEELHADRDGMGTRLPAWARRMASRFSKLADRMGLREVADRIRAFSQTEAEQFIASMVRRSGDSGPVLLRGGRFHSVGETAGEASAQADASSSDNAATMFSRSASTKAVFEAQIDALFSGAKAAMDTRLLDASEVMGLLGYPRVPLMLNEPHLRDGFTTHPEMTAAVWKKLPEWIEGPAAVYADPRQTGRLVVIAPELVAGYPVMMVIEPKPTPSNRDKGGPFHLLVTAYAKTSGVLPSASMLIADGHMKYVDTKNAPEIWQSTGVQFPRQSALSQGRQKILTEKQLGGYKRAQASAAAAAPKDPASFRRADDGPGLTDDQMADLLRIMRPEPAEFSDAARAQAVSRVRATVDAIRAGWANGPEVIVAYDMDDPAVPAAARRADLRQRSRGATGAPEGFYWRGKAYLLASKLNTPADAARVLHHEVLGHHGLRGLFGRDLDQILNQVAAMRQAEVDAKIKDYGLRGVALGRRTAAEEVLAEMAEKTPQLHFVRRAVAAIRNWLRAHVPGLKSWKMSDADIIQAYILPARDFVQRGAAAERMYLHSVAAKESLLKPSVSDVDAKASERSSATTSGDVANVATPRNQGKALASDAVSMFSSAPEGTPDTGDKVLWERAQTNHLAERAPSAVSGQSTGSNVAQGLQKGNVRGASQGLRFSATSDVPPGSGLTLEQAQKAVEEALAGLRSPPPIDIVARSEQAWVGAPEGVMGAAIPEEGRIVLVASAHGSADAVIETVFHEMFHLGVRNVLPTPDYVQSMLDLAKRDARVQQYAIEWKTKAPDAPHQLRVMRERGYTGSDLTARYEALAIEEGLAVVAEELRAQKRAGTRLGMRVRTLANWLSGVAERMGMQRLADRIRRMTYNEAERFVMRAIESAGEGGVMAAGGGPAARAHYRVPGDNPESWHEGAAAERMEPTFSRGASDPAEAFASEVRTAIAAGLADDKNALRVQVPVGIETPAVLQMLGVARKPVMTNRDLIAKMHFEHGVTRSELVRLGDLLSNPVMVFKSESKDGRFVVVTNLVNNGRPVIVAVEPNGKTNNTEVVYLPSAYPKDNADSVFSKWIKQGLLQYADKQQSRQLATNARLQLPGVVQRAVGFKAEYKTEADLAQSPDDDLMFSRSRLSDIKASALEQLQQTLSHEGKVSWWDKTIGTMRHLAERAPAFKPVYETAQRNIDDVSMLANDAADRAPRLLPRVDTLGDLIGKNRKTPVAAADNKAVARPLFEGTLTWARDVDGQPMQVDDLAKKYANLPADDKAQLMLRAGRLDDRILRAWRGLPLAQYEANVNSRFERKMLKAGVVWTDAELKSMFGATAGQIALYREARAAIDRSIDMTARADMMRALGDDYAGMRDMVLDAPTLADAMQLLTETLQQDARAKPDMAERLLQLNNMVVDRAAQARELQEDGYAPLSRFGRYTLDVVDAHGERQYFGMYETMRESNLAKLQMAQAFPGAKITQGTMSQQSYKLFAGITPETLEIFKDMVVGTEADAATRKVFDEYLKLTKNNHSALKRLIQRKGIEGYSQDVGRVVANFVYSNARQAAAGLNAGTMDRAINNIPKEQGELKDLAMGLRDYIRDPQEEGQAVRGMLFAQYLGGSLASAMVNMTQPFAVTMPWLSQFGGMRAAGAQMTRAMNDMRRAWRDKGFQYESDLAMALQSAEDDGVVSPQEVHQLMAQARGAGGLRSGDGTRAGDARAAAANAWERTKVAWGQPFALAEQFNRRSTFIAAFRIAKAQGMADPGAFARKAVLETQFVYSKANKPKWARGAVGGTLFTFKTYSVSYLELMQRMLTQGGPEGRRAVGWALAMLLMMGGAGGVPFMEDIEDLIDGIGQMMGYNFSAKQARKEFLHDILGKELAEFIEQGISGLPGAPIDISGRLGMGNLIPGTGLLLTKQDRERDLMEMAGPAGDLVARGFTGVRKALTGDVGGAALEVAPTAVRNAAKGIDMATSGMYKDTKGYKVIDTTLGEAVAKFAGFQPRSVAADSEASAFKQRIKSFYTLTSSEIKAQWADALFRKDDDALARVRERLQDWNRDNPDQPIVVRMPDVWKKVREMGKDRTDRIADTAPKALRAQMREVAKDVG